MTDKSRSAFLRHFIYVFGSQLIVLISGFIKALAIPVLLGLSDYGYWQIYVFYTVHIGLFTFGYGDGLYLKYGGHGFTELPLPRIRSANIVYLGVLMLGKVALVAFALTNSDPDRQTVYLAVAANVILLGLISIVSLTLQATNELKGYAFINSADKVFFTLALLALLSEDFQTFTYLIGADIASKLVVLLVLLQRYRPLFLGSLARRAEGVKEFFDSAGAGIQLLIANLSGMLVLGVGRIIVEYQGALGHYAHYAFSVSLANVVLISITALSIVIYPTLRRQPRDNYLLYFDKTTRAYAVFALVMLTGYFPALAFIEQVAPAYQPVAVFLNAMFVITVLQGKMQLVNNTYYKALRLERPMLVANLASLLIAAALSWLGFVWFHSILAVVYAALVTMLFRVYASEIFLLRHMGVKPELQLLAEPLILGGFLLVTSLLSAPVAAGLWLLMGASLALIRRAALRAAWQQLRGRRR
ncbi:lipopolysaccharide biosynthesis protein [Tabrizicola soli]|uniref:Lipopolysaccharide biosynthesis protein n=1 Tax=Tabrizicola soli TaxID=2185115 RepID=A0ABV7DXS6_9RHOB|nr:hypothetical protein [Tabrizicola soli]